MNKVFALLSFILVCIPVRAAGSTSSTQSREDLFYQGPKPVAVVIQSTPMMSPASTLVPLAAIYDDGQIVYLKRANPTQSIFAADSVYVAKKLNPSELDQIRKKIAGFGDYHALAGHYSVFRATDQPSTYLYFSTGETTFTTGIYGLSSPNRHPKEFQALPAAIQAFYNFMTTFDYADAKQWEPSYIKIIAWKNPEPAVKTVPWPTEWPGLHSPNTFTDRGYRLIYIPGNQISKYHELAKIEAQPEQNHNPIAKLKPVLTSIDGQAWFIQMKYVFPREDIWTKAIHGNYSAPQLISR